MANTDVVNSNGERTGPFASEQAAGGGDQKSLTVPVVRDQGYRLYSPDRFSVMRRASDAGEKFEIRLQSVVHRELSQSLNLSPDGEGLGVTRRDVRIEVVEWAGIEMTLQQMTRLRDEFSGAIQSTKPRPEHALRNRLVQLNAQIEAAETELARCKRKLRPHDAGSPEAQEIAALNRRVDAVMREVAGRAAPASASRPSLFDQLPPHPMPEPAPAAPRRGRMALYVLGVACLLCLGGVAGWLAEEFAPAAVQLAERRMSVTPEPSRAEAPPSAVPSAGGSLSPAASPLQAHQAAPASDVPADQPVQAPDNGAAGSPAHQESSIGAQETNPGQTASGELPKDQAAPAAVPTPPPAAVQTAPAITPATTGPAGSVDPAPAQEAGATLLTAGKATPEPASAHIEIRASGTTWVRVRDPSGRVYLERVLKAGDTWAVPQVPGLQMTTGNAGVTSLSVDGVNTAPFGAVGSVWAGILTR